MRLSTWTLAFVALVLPVAPALSAQSTVGDSGGLGAERGVPASAAALPVDRIADLLALEPGVVSLDQGELSIRGAGADALAIYLDGVPVTPGHRLGGGASLGGSWFGARGSGVAIGTNGFEEIRLATGVTGAEFGGARGGILGVTSRNPAEGGDRSVRLHGSWATDAPLGTGHGLDFNRVLLDGDGRFGRLSLSVAAAAEGQGSARLGLEQNGSPVYLADGVDTSVTVTGGGGTTSVDVLRFTPSPGIRIPSSATSNYTLLARVGYALGAASRVQVTAAASQDQTREFDYPNLYNAAQLRADRSWSRVVTGSWYGNLVSRDGVRLGAEAHLSWQTDRSTSGPLTTSGEQGSRSPFGGFLLAPLDFRFDAATFPVNDQLIRNFRTNTGRLSPYDLGNTSQYSLIQQYRTNAYGLVAGFSESGGPVGLLRLSEEDRLVAKGVVDARIGERHWLRVGAEITGYRERYYRSGLTSQAYADAYVESPKRQALFADYQLSLNGLTVGVGLRYDRFRTGASRPYFTDSSGSIPFPRISTMPGFNPADPTAFFVADRSHRRFSPDIQLQFVASPRLTLHGGFGWAAQMPELGQSLAGINTDLSVTSFDHIFGTDLDFERRSIGEVGARFALDARTIVDGSIWTRRDEGVVRVELLTRYDSLRKQSTDIESFVNGGPRTARGLELRVQRELGAHGQAWLGYSYTDATISQPTIFGSPATMDIAARDTRPHVLTGAVSYQTGPGGTALAGLLRSTSVAATFRIGSGTAYTECQSDPSALSGDACSVPSLGALNGFRLPMMKTLDLRLTKGFPIGGTTITAFADARNLLNWRNVTRLFAQTGSTSNSAERRQYEIAQAQALAAEAGRNGVLLSDSTIDLSFGGAQDPRGGCGGWQAANGVDATPNCGYLIGAEQRFGNGDHLFTAAEQTRAVDAFYLVGRGLQNFTSAGRRVRLGVEVGF